MNDRSIYTTTDRLSDKAAATFSGGGGGDLMLSLIMIMSGILSAIYFWKNAGLMFSGVPDYISLPLALACGFLPNEYAFFAWRWSRTEKQNMTAVQVFMTGIGASLGTAGSLLGTVALFITSLQIVPAELVEIRTWLAFLALSFPMLAQVVCIAIYNLAERRTVQNHERSKLAAMGFDAWTKFEQARIQSIIDGMGSALDQQLGGYGSRAGRGEAGKFLDDKGRELLDMGQPKRDSAVASQDQERLGFQNKPANQLTVMELNELLNARLEEENSPANFTLGGV